MQILITGGAGFIGSHLAEHLLRREHTVTLLDDLSTGRRENVAHLLDRPNCELVVGSVADEALLDRHLRHADRVYHLAAAVGVDLIVQKPVHTIETNIHGCETVLRAAARRGVPTLLTSTSEVYGKTVKIPFHEDDDVVYGSTKYRRWSYAVSKAVDEFLALAYHQTENLPVVIARLFNTVGPRQTGEYGMVVPRFVRAALRGEPLRVFGDGQQSRCFADVGDVVEGLIGLIESPETMGEVFNLGNDQPVTIEQLAQRVIALTDSDSEIVFVPYEQAYAPGFEDMRARQPALEKIRRATGYRPTHQLDDILQRVINWMCEHDEAG